MSIGVTCEGLVATRSVARLVSEGLETLNDLRDVREHTMPPPPLGVTGERGVGRRTLAKALHDRGPRAGGPFVLWDACDVGRLVIRGGEETRDVAVEGVPPDPRRSWLVFALDAAYKGTLAVLNMEQAEGPDQAVLGQYLDAGRSPDMPIGEPGRDIDVEVILIGERDPHEAGADGRLRGDTAFNCIHSIFVPPLRERAGEINVLIDWLLISGSRAAGIAPPKLDPRARAALRRYAWPGNVAELKQVASRLIALRQAEMTADAVESVLGLRA